MTLAELMVAIGLGSLVLAVAMALMLYGTRGCAAIANYADLDKSSRSALDRIISDIRQADKLTFFSTNRMDFQTTDPNSGAVNTLTYTYNANGKTLSRTFTNQTIVVLTGCQLWQAAFFQRNTTNATYDQYPVDDPSRPDLCKVIQLTWTCSRTVAGLPINTESVQSAKVVMRKP